MYTVKTLKSKLTGKIGGSSLDRVNDINSVIEEGALKLLGEIDLSSTKRSYKIESGLSVFNDSFIVPDDLKGSSIIDIARFGARGNAEYFSQTYSQPWRRGLRDNLYTVETINRKKVLRLKVKSPNTYYASFPFNDSSIFNVTGSFNGLKTSTFNTTDDSSISFNVDDKLTTGSLYTSQLTKTDFSSLTDKTSIVVSFETPESSTITSATVRLGSSPTDYYEFSTTKPVDTATFQDGFNVISFKFTNLKEVGNVNTSSIVYFNFTLNHSVGKINDVRLYKLSIIDTSRYEVVYYSDCMFVDSITGEYRNTVVSENDILNITSEEYLMLLYSVMIVLLPEIFSGQELEEKKAYYSALLKDELDNYSFKNPSEAQKKQAYLY